jgi:hypothetical protein
MMPASGRIITEDGTTVNVVDLLSNGSVSPVSNEVYNIDAYSPRSGRVIGEDGRLYNIVDLLAAGGGGDGNNGGTQVKLVIESLRMEATGDNVLTIFKGSTIIHENGGVSVFDADRQIGAGNLDNGSFVVGQDYGVFLNNTGAVTISITETMPYSRKIGGFHYSVNRRTNAALQPINTAGVVKGEGWEANIYNGILPRSVWTFLHRPKCKPNGMVYLANGVWVDIYESSDDGAGGLLSKHNVLPITGFSWYSFTEKMLVTGKRMLTYSEFVQAAMGSPPGTSGGNENGWTSGSESQYTGFVERAVSSVGCRDCVGNAWEWLSDLIASGSGVTGEGVWQDPMPSQNAGQMWLIENNNFRALLAGGSYFNGSLIGARSAGVLYTPWSSASSFGVRGACASL